MSVKSNFVVGFRAFVLGVALLAFAPNSSRAGVLELKQCVQLLNMESLYEMGNFLLEEKYYFFSSRGASDSSYQRVTYAYGRERKTAISWITIYFLDGKPGYIRLTVIDKNYREIMQEITGERKKFRCLSNEVGDGFLRQTFEGPVRIVATQYSAKDDRLGVTGHTFDFIRLGSEFDRRGIDPVLAGRKR